MCLLSGWRLHHTCKDQKAFIEMFCYCLGKSRTCGQNTRVFCWFLRFGNECRLTESHLWLFELHICSLA
jgi:hypothetical protein